MKKLSVGQASRSLGEYAAELDDDIVVVTKGARAVAALVPLRNVDRESLALSAHPEFLKLIGRARAEIAAGKSLSLADVRRRVLSQTASKARQPARAAKPNGRRGTSRVGPRA
jgi:antitoxin (DNA-binding transcriptional repressor) of toxin-antitoxin stability system